MAPHTPLTLRPAVDQLDALNRREISAVELLDEHVDVRNRLHDSINAVVTVDIDAAQVAARDIDNRRAAGEPVGPLAGLPMSIKDALATAGLRTTGGAIELADQVPTADAAAVSAVRHADAVVYGKSNLPRWSGDIQASNDIFGTTNNPWDLTRGPGGSSGGAAAALATGMTSVEIGTDIGGSIRLPAHFSGVCGHKPSFGIVAQDGYVDHLSWGAANADVNVVGPMGRNIADVSLLLDVLTGPSHDLSPAWQLTLPAAVPAEQARVGAWLDDPACPITPEVAAVIDAAVAALEADGCVVDRAARPAHDFADVYRIGMPLVSAAVSPGRTDEEFAGLLARIDDGDEMLAMRAGATTMRHRDWLLLAEERTARRRSWADFFTRYDILLAPVAFTAAFEHQTQGNLYTRTLPTSMGDRAYADLIAWTTQFGYVYLPATVVPAGWTPDGLPVGIQIVGRYLGDHTCLAMAARLENLLGGYRIPPIALT